MADSPLQPVIDAIKGAMPGLLQAENDLLAKGKQVAATLADINLAAEKAAADRALGEMLGVVARGGAVVAQDAQVAWSWTKKTVVGVVSSAGVGSIAYTLWNLRHLVGL